MKKLLFLFLVTASFIANAQTDEELREVIRAEILEEQRQQEAKELLEYRKEKIRREEEARIKAEKDSAKNELLAKQQQEVATIDNSSTELHKNVKRRIRGWAIGINIGPNFALGDYASKNKDFFAGTGFATNLHNYIHFGKLGGIFIGLGYETNAFKELDFEDRLESSLQPGVTIHSTGSVPYKNYTMQVGGVIRKLGTGSSFVFRPYVGLNIINGADYTVALNTGNSLETISAVQKTATMFMVGSAIELGAHIGKFSDITLGLDARFAFGNIPWEVSSTVTPTEFGWDNITPIRLALVAGYRFHL